MPTTFFGVDNEFAASTGDNVNVTENTSRFDNPPSGSKDLVVTSNDGDSDPRLFELGETYDVSWGGQGGGGFIEDAVVIRSDETPDGQGGIIVFEGTDENGEPAQIIWTPDFDLEGWYKENYNPSDEPQFYTQDTQPNYTHRVACYTMGTLIGTPSGPRPVERLGVGDLVWTRDHGAQRVRWTGRRRMIGVGRAAPVLFAPGVLGNARPLRVSPQHRILATTPDEVLIPAKAYLGQPGVRRDRVARVSYLHLLLDAHQVLCAEGAASESLYLGPQAGQLLRAYGTDGMVARRLGVEHQAPARRLLSVREGRAYLARAAPVRGQRLIVRRAEAAL